MSRRSFRILHSSNLNPREQPHSAASSRPIRQIAVPLATKRRTHVWAPDHRGGCRKFAQCLMYQRCVRTTWRSGHADRHHRLTDCANKKFHRHRLSFLPRRSRLSCQPHFSHSNTYGRESSGLNPTSRLYEPQAGQLSGLPLSCRITALPKRSATD
jgi:hypothetical protein